MEKVKFAFADGNGEDEFFILEETKINGSAYILVQARAFMRSLKMRKSYRRSPRCLRNFLKMSVLNSDLRRKLHCMLWELLRVSTGNRTVIYKI